ncbi:MAG TPA: neutral zinc metallopeptidase, partial [Minicystis sp.]|nr:neutral zinc metallopeptidase [Minicystis sp.]
MKWDEDHESPDVVDRRGEADDGGGPGFSPGSVFWLLPLLRSPFGWIILVAVALWFGLSELGIVGGGDTRAHGVHHPAEEVRGGREDAREVHFVSFVLDDVQATWA